MLRTIALSLSNFIIKDPGPASSGLYESEEVPDRCNGIKKLLYLLFSTLYINILISKAAASAETTEFKTKLELKISESLLMAVGEACSSRA